METKDRAETECLCAGSFTCSVCLNQERLEREAWVNRPPRMKTAAAQTEFASTYFAFRQWFLRATNGDADLGAVVLIDLCKSNRGSVAWLCLEMTGEKKYSSATFRMAAEMVLELATKEAAK